MLVWLCTLPLSALSVLLWPIHPLPSIMLLIAAKLVSLLDRAPLSTSHGVGQLGFLLVMSVIWPLTLVPLHCLNFHLLQWNVRLYLGLFLFTNLLIAFLLVLHDSSPWRTPLDPAYCRTGAAWFWSLNSRWGCLFLP